MDEELTLAHQRWPLPDGLQQNAVLIFADFEVRAAPQPKTVPERLWENDTARMIDSECHAIHGGICHG
jgi:hypothetical protein